MSYYAFLDKNNTVIEVIAGVDENELIEGKAPEIWYGQFKNLRCLRTSFNSYSNIHSGDGEPFRKNYAGIGFSYNEELDAFVPPKPFNSWLLDEETCLWKAPVEYPADDKAYVWDEAEQGWVLDSSVSGSEVLDSE